MNDELYKLIDKTGDYKMDLDIYKIFKQSLGINEIHYNTIHVIIDLSIYGQELDMPIIVNKETYYLDKLQKDRIKKIWSKINPNTESGKKFNIIIESSKSLCDAYNLK
jgi:hypothetical protein